MIIYRAENSMFVDMLIFRRLAHAILIYSFRKLTNLVAYNTVKKKQCVSVTSLVLKDLY